MCHKVYVIYCVPCDQFHREVTIMDLCRKPQCGDPENQMSLCKINSITNKGKLM